MTDASVLGEKVNLAAITLAAAVAVQKTKKGKRNSKWSKDWPFEKKPALTSTRMNKTARRQLSTNIDIQINIIAASLSN